LIECCREGRTLFYSVNFGSMNALVAYLTENCCQGQSEDCSTPAFCVQEEEGN